MDPVPPPAPPPPAPPPRPPVAAPVPAPTPPPPPPPPGSVSASPPNDWLPDGTGVAPANGRDFKAQGAAVAKQFAVQAAWQAAQHPAVKKHGKRLLLTTAKGIGRALMRGI